MANLIVKEAKGFSKEEAATSVGFEAPLKYDATIAYNAAKDSKGFNLSTFLESYLNDKAKGIPGAGVYVTLESGKKDTRQRPYHVTNVVNVGRRKYKSQTMIVDVPKEGEFTRILGFADTKSQGEALGKQLVTQLRINVKGIPVHVVEEGTTEAFNIEYVPSLGTKEGSYVFASL